MIATDSLNPADLSLRARLYRGIWPRSVALWAVAFWMALFIIRPWERLFPSLGAVHIERTWALLVIGTVIASGSVRLFSSFQTVAVLLLLAALIGSFYCAGDSHRAWKELYEFITLAIFYFVLLCVIRAPYELFFIATCYVAVMGLYLAKAEFEYFFHGAGQYRMGVWRMIGIEDTYGDPNSVAGSTVLSLPILLFVWNIRQTFTETWPKTWRVALPLCLLLYFLVAMTAVVLTNSRSGMLGVAVFVFLAVLGGGSSRKKLLGLVGAVLLLGVIWGLMPEESKNRLRTVWDPSRGPKNAQESAEGRIEGLKAGGVMFSRFPLTGVGIGSFIPYRVLEVDGVPLHAHNLLGQMLGETGCLGTGAFLLMLAALFANCRRTKALAKRNRCQTVDMLSRLAVACRDSVILLLFFGFFGHNMLRFNWLWLAGFAMLCRKFSEEVCAESDINELGRNISGQEYFPTDRCGEATTRAATGGWESTV